MRVPSDLPGWRRAAELVGRRAQCGVLDRLVGSVRSGGSGALVVHGDPGVGKTALLDYLAVQALGFRVLRSGGVQSEMELAYAGLHQLCAPLLDGLERLPAPQRAALGTAFGLSAGPAPDRFLVGLAVLSLLSDVAERQPVLCLVDDQQWLDRASAQVLAFVARRLGAEAVGLLFATRVVGGDLAGLPELAVDGLRQADARALLDAVLSGPIDERVREQIVAETSGNPLALLELPRGLTPADLAGGFGLPGALPLSGSIEESFGQRAAALADPARLALLVAAADPSGDPALVCRAITGLGIDVAAAAKATEAGLVEFGARVRFRHPLARSAVYRSASAADRHRAHAALAAATDPDVDPDRRAWHRAQAVALPDETVAVELERSAGRARARGGLAAAAAFLQRAATLTPDLVRRADRALAAAQAELEAGAFDAALDLLAMATSGPLTDLQQAQVGLLRARLAFVTNRGGDAPALLLKAAQRLAPIDATLSRATYLEALHAAIFAGRSATAGGDILDVARAARAAPPAPREPLAPDLLLDGNTANFTDSYAAGLPASREALRVLGVGMTADEELRWLYLASVMAIRLWDDVAWDRLSARHLRLARATGALSELPLALTSHSYTLLFAGDLATVATMNDELRAIEEATGSHLTPYGALGLSAFRGDETVARAVIEEALADATRRGEGVGITFAHWARAVLCNGHGRYREALAAALRAVEYDNDPGQLVWVWPELVEAAVRAGDPAAAAPAHYLLAGNSATAGTDWSLGIRARTTALLGDRQEDSYVESITRLGNTRMRVQLGRSHLLYGEWLRRQRRHSEARAELRTAHRMLDSMGVAGFAERAARELRAAGGTVRRRVDASRHEELTAQEAQIARLARDGLSNPEIATRLFISARTVQYHLRKVFTKLGITSRGQLAHVLPQR